MQRNRLTCLGANRSFVQPYQPQTLKAKAAKVTATAPSVGGSRVHLFPARHSLKFDRHIKRVVFKYFGLRGWSIY